MQGVYRPERLTQLLASIVECSAADIQYQHSLNLVARFACCVRRSYLFFVFALYPFRTPVPVGGQGSQIPQLICPQLFPKRDCSPKRVNLAMT